MQSPAFTGATIDRAAELRADPAAVAALRGDPGAVLVAGTGEMVLVDPGAARLARCPVARCWPPGQLAMPAQPAPILLGLQDGAPVFAVDLGDPPERPDLVQDGELMPLRDAGTRLSQPEGGLAAYLVALLGWHRRHRFCANCGEATKVAEAGLSRHCERCGANHFPRTDPVVIMLVEHDDRLLLGRRAGWPEGRYSVLTGFVAPGETPEEAVVREVAEESGIVVSGVGGVKYVAAQPWPFPASLMLGFEARADGGTPAVGDRELEAVAWYSREQVAAAARAEPESPGQGLQLPPPVSIARYLIDRWLAAR